MQEAMFFQILLIAHGILCLVLLVLVRKRELTVSYVLYLFAVLVPLWGVGMLWLTHHYTEKGKINSRKLQLNQSDSSFYSLIQPFVEGEETIKHVMPIEEALLLKDPSIRRRLMKEIVQENPERYIPVLQRGLLSEDMEVSHYASAALMQIQTDYEVALHEQELLLKQDENLEQLRDYIQLLEDYIGSGLLPKNALTSQRWNLQAALLEYLKGNPDHQEFYLSSIDNAIELGQITEAKLLVQQVKEKWPQDESVFLLQLKLHYVEEDTDALQSEIKVAEEKNFYLSPAARVQIAIWKK